MYFECIKTTSGIKERKVYKKKQTDADTMCGNKFIPVTWKAYIPHCLLLIQGTTLTMESVKSIPHQRDFGKILL